MLTGEHGVGVEKRDLMPEMFNEADLDQQQRVKCAFDPAALLNPGKVFPALHRCAELGRMHVHRGAARLSGPAAVLMRRDARLTPRHGRARCSKPSLGAARRCRSKSSARAPSAGIGRPVQAGHTLDARRPVRRHLYEPEELVLTARRRHAARRNRGAARRAWPAAGLRAAGLRRRCLADCPASGTLGGMLAANLSGPRRLEGRRRARPCARHHGRVAAAARRSSPAAGWSRTSPATTCPSCWPAVGHAGGAHRRHLQGAAARRDRDTLALRGLERRRGRRRDGLAMGSAAEVSSAAHLPECRAARRRRAGQRRRRPCCGWKVSRLPSPHGSASLRRPLGAFPDDEILQGDASARRLAGDPRLPAVRRGGERPVWRVSVAPAAGPTLVDLLRREAAADAFYDWEGGLVWLRMRRSTRRPTLVSAAGQRPAAATRRWCARRRNARRQPRVRAPGARRSRLSRRGSSRRSIRTGVSTPAAWF